MFGDTAGIFDEASLVRTITTSMHDVGSYYFKKSSSDLDTP